jgi:rhamnose transport system ATP-binding protein
VTALLEVFGASKRFGATAALTDLSFSLEPGERLAVLGENGAGKSTLIKIIAGVYSPDSGHMKLNGQDYTPDTPADALASGVSIVYQEPSYFAQLTVLENIFVGREMTDRFGQVDWRGMRKHATALFERLSLPVGIINRRMGVLSLAEQQLVLIARAVDVEAKVLILDEPTSIVTDAEAQRLFSIVRHLSDTGVGILYITHRFDELEHVADRFLVLKDGRQVGDLPAGNVNNDEILELMSGRPIDHTIVRHGTVPGEPMLEVSGLTVSSSVKDADLMIRAGEVVGMYGLIGSGRSELALGLFGMLPVSAGTVRIGGKPYTPRSPRDAMARGLAYMPEDRKTLGIFSGMDTTSNLTAAVLPRLVGAFDAIRRKAELTLTRTWIDRLRIKAPTPAFPIAGLSGGHQQKVIFARVLATEPKLLILDEPTRGIDVATKSDIQRRIIDVAQDGVAILVISSELPELLAVSDRMYVMREGRISAHLTGESLNEDAVLRATMGVAQ